jgi:hypothetical protein
MGYPCGTLMIEQTSGKKCYFEKPLEEFENGELNICGDKQVGLFMYENKICDIKKDLCMPCASNGPLQQVKMRICTFEINNRENFTTLNPIKKIINERKRVMILPSDGIKTSKIDTETNIASFLDEEDRSTS